MERMVKQSPRKKTRHGRQNSHSTPTNAGAISFDHENAFPDDQEFVHEVQPMRRRPATNQVSLDFILHTSFSIDRIQEHLSG